MTANIGHSFYKDYFRKLKIRKSDGVPTLDGKTVTNKLEGYSLESFKNCQVTKD